MENQNSLSDSQRETLRKWVDESSDNVEEYNEIHKVLTYSQRLQAMRKVDTLKDLQTMKSKISSSGVVRKIYSNFQKVAAVIVVPLIIYTAFSIIGHSILNDGNGIVKSTETAFGVRSQIQLSDGTKVWLNSGSKLFYPENFKGNKRQVKLLGEAYFQVQSDKRHPFYVDLGDFMIKATGTKFNISNYKDDCKTTTYLESGVVSLVEMRNDKETRCAKLNSGEKVVVHKAEKRINIQKVDGTKYLSWIEGKLIFNNDNMLDVANKLGHWFNAEFVIEDAALNEYVFTATFENESLEEVLRLLSYTSPIEYKIINNYQLDDSTYTKRKVIIEKTEKNMN
ncbi:FecR family protein [Sunxiuqinia sp. A32]|uniref:FecR family protein n=1 Tax=Sunxiuqinia sp. A32 TaxID=3461496 RepID=UPI004045EC48